MDEAALLELTYFDKATISGQIPYTKPNGAIAFKNGIKAESVKCAISKKEPQILGETETVANIKYTVVMFCRPDTNIAAGDDVQVTFESGLKKNYIAGEPFPYSSHLEVPLTRKDRN
ncbi:hypothetical protein [Clostridium sp.]|jgi:hypothetical protein|uniref:hypothetical protein n=1 Tax=Clostridium sp. TaxID=1506 RepID=UPI002FDD9A3A